MKKRQCLVLITGLLVGLLLGCEGRDRAGAGDRRCRRVDGRPG